MKKNIRIFLVLLLSSSSMAQTKPRNPSVPSGTWAMNLISAFAFSRRDSIAGDSLKDWMDGSYATVCSYTNTWGSVGGETPLYQLAGGTSSSFCGTKHIPIRAWQGLVTDQLTIILRVYSNCSGACKNAFGLVQKANAIPTSVAFDDVDFDNDASNFTLVNASGISKSVNVGRIGTSGSMHTVILTYAGDSLRAYLDGAFKGATAQSGNVLLSQSFNYATSLGVSADASFYYSWTGWFSMAVIYARVITAAERTQIWSDPFVMFRGFTTRNRVVVIE